MGKCDFIPEGDDYYDNVKDAYVFHRKPIYDMNLPMFAQICDPIKNKNGDDILWNCQLFSVSIVGNGKYRGMYKILYKIV